MQPWPQFGQVATSHLARHQCPAPFYQENPPALSRQIPAALYCLRQEEASVLSKAGGYDREGDRQCEDNSLFATFVLITSD